MHFPSDLVWIIIALFGGIARYLDTYLKGKETFSIPRMIANIIICGFSGYMCAEVMLLMYPSWALISAGIGGYAGVEALNFLVEIWKNKFTVEVKNGKSDDK